MLTAEEIRTATKEVVYVGRDGGAIKRFWRNKPKNEPSEAIYEDDPEVQTFLAPVTVDRSNLATHDKTVRVLVRVLATELNITSAQARVKFAAAWVAENGGGGK